MKQIYKYILPGAVAALALAGCGNEYDGLSDGNVAPSFTATIEGTQTRVAGTSWQPGDEIGISYSKKSNPAYEGVTNACYVTQDGSGAFTVKEGNDPVYFPIPVASTQEVTFYAYYPWTPTTATTVTIDTSDQTKQQSFDYLWASAGGTKDDPSVKFEFKHKMSKVTFVFINGRNMDVSEIISYTLQPSIFLKGTLSLTAGTCSGTSVRNPVTVNLSEVREGEPVTPLILLPQTLRSDYRPAKFEIESRDGQRYEASLNFPDDKLEAGNNYKFTIMVNKTGLTVSNCTIEDWTEYEWPEGGGQGTADPADAPKE